MSAPSGIPIQQLLSTTTLATVYAGNTQAAVSIGVLSTSATLIPTYYQIVSTVPATMELHWGTPAATVSTNRIMYIPGLLQNATASAVVISGPIVFGGLSTTLSIRSATATPVTGGSIMINLWR